MARTTTSASFHTLASPATISAGASTANETSSFEGDVNPIRKVFDITELCEQILNNLSAEDPFTARFVSHAILYVIKGSKTLQEKVFLRGADYTKKPTLDFGSSGITVEGRPPLRFSNDIRSLPKTALVVRPFVLNTILLSKMLGRPGVHWKEYRIIAINTPFDSHYRRPYIGPCERFKLKKPPVRSGRYLEDHRAMLLTQPPDTKIIVYMCNVDKATRRPILTTATIMNPIGVRLQEILDEADRSKREVLRVGFPGEVVVTPELKERFEAWSAAICGIRS